MDLGAHSTDRVDYPEYGAAVGHAVSSGEAKYGVCVCGSGVGISMAANKISGVRAALVNDAASAELTRQHNDANILCFGERSIEFEVAETALEAWLNAEFEGGRHLTRVEKLNALSEE